MECVFDRFSREGWAEANWLMLGKGPSLNAFARLDTSAYRTVALNHVVREQKVDLAHLIDLEVVEQAGEALLANAGAVVLPWHPHIGHVPLELELPEIVADSPILSRLEAENRLLWYNAETSPFPNPHSSLLVGVKFFSAEAVTNLLALAGVRHIRTLGIDGGTTYYSRFADLRGSTLLANGRATFDVQFREIAQTIRTRHLDFGPLDQQVPARVFVGTTPEQMLATQVLEFSIRQHASLSVEVVPLFEVVRETPLPRDPANQPRTPFSFQRFSIPELCGHKGRALYVDSDMQVFSDLRRLWSLPFEDADLLAVGDTQNPDRPPQFSVMLLDCERLGWKISDIVAGLDAGELDYTSLMHQMKVAKKIETRVPPEWNHLEKYQDGKTCLLHYTDMNLQPWVSRRNPNGYLWCRALRAAVEEGFVTREYVQDHVERGWVRPSLLAQLDKKIDDPRKLDAADRLLDRDFCAPFEALVTKPRSPLKRLRKWAERMTGAQDNA